jgi:hypothetical protein
MPLPITDQQAEVVGQSLLGMATEADSRHLQQPLHQLIAELLLWVSASALHEQTLPLL